MFKLFIFLLLIFSFSNLMAEGFSPAKVGLIGDIIKLPDGVFKYPRPWIDGKTCPHKGVDFTSRVSNSPAPKDITAGVWGKVRNPVGGDWGTITIRPFYSTSSLVKSIHTSMQTVKVDDIVAPWTVIGKTGDKVAPGTKPVDAIHLHLHVDDPSGFGHECYTDKRTFLDPTTTDTGNPISQDWKLKEIKPDRTIQLGNENVIVKSTITMVLPIRSDEINSSFVYTVVIANSIPSKNYHCESDTKIKSQVIGREHFYFIVKNTWMGCTGRPKDCPCPEKTDIPDSQVLLIGGDQLYFAGNRLNKAAIYREELIPRSSISEPMPPDAKKYFDKIKPELPDFGKIIKDWKK